MDPQEVQALVVLSFGGPEGMPEVMPFLERVVAGRGVPTERLAAVAEQYRRFDGVSPLNGENRRLVATLGAAAPRAWLGERVYLANRNSPPFVADTLGELAGHKVNRAAVFITSAFSSYSGCRQYRENLAEGLQRSGTPIELLVLPRFHDHPILRGIWADRVRAAEPDEETRVIFVTHSLPEAQAGSFVPGVTGYLAQHREFAGAVAAAIDAATFEGGSATDGTVAGQRPSVVASAEVGRPPTRQLDWCLAFQSRSGPPTQPWLEPDISAAIEQAADEGCKRVVVAPIGFCADNLEIRWDLDTVAAQTAAECGISFERLEPPQSDPRFADLVWDLFAAADGTPCLSGCCPNPKGPRRAAGERVDLQPAQRQAPAGDGVR